MIALIFAALLAFFPASAGSESLHVRIEIGDAAGAVPEVRALEGGVATQCERAFGRFVEIRFDGPVPGAPNARVTIERQQGVLSVSTELSRGAVTRAASSTVPVGAPGSLVGAIQGDLAFLFFSLVDFSPLSLSAPPGLAATLQTDTLQQCTAWDPSELEPLDLAPSGDEVVVCFPHRYLTLGPLFDITAETVRDVHAQSTGREPLQLSGVAAGQGEQLYLLSEAEHTIVAVSPRLGTRQLVDAPELSGLGARMLGEGSLAILTGSPRLSVSVRSPSRGAQWSLPVGASYVSAFCTDGEGNLWLWDATERRIRILAANGLETYSIKPLFKASFMPLPQQIQVFDDGSFLLGGSGEVWKFRASGVPVWRLTRLPGRPAEKLPSSFVLAANRADGSFALLDAPSRRLMRFVGTAPSAAEAQLAAFLSRMDSRNPSDLEEAARVAGTAGLSLEAWQFADLLARRTGDEGARAEARMEILRQKVRLYVELADSLARNLLYERADGAYLRAGEWLRQIAAESPGDEEAARLLEGVVSRRQEIRQTLSTASDLRVDSAQAARETDDACDAAAIVRLRVHNGAAESLSTVRIHLSIPGLSAAPSLAALDSLAPGEEREVVMSADLAAASAGPVTARALVTCVRGREGFSAALSFPVAVGAPLAPASAANVLACGTGALDQLVASLPDDLLPAGSRGDPLTAFASEMESLGRLRALAAGAAPVASRPSADGTSGVRATLRGLSLDERDWALLTVSVASSLGLRAGLLIWHDRTFALLETDVALVDALSAIPGLARFQKLLSALGNGGSFCVPLSGRPVPVGKQVVAWSVVDALAALESADPVPQGAWASASAPREPLSVPLAFPYPVPAMSAPFTREAMQAEIESELESAVHWSF